MDGEGWRGVRGRPFSMSFLSLNKAGKAYVSPPWGYKGLSTLIGTEATSKPVAWNLHEWDRLWSRANSFKMDDSQIHIFLDKARCDLQYVVAHHSNFLLSSWTSFAVTYVSRIIESFPYRRSNSDQPFTLYLQRYLQPNFGKAFVAFAWHSFRHCPLDHSCDFLAFQLDIRRYARTCFNCTPFPLNQCWNFVAAKKRASSEMIFFTGPNGSIISLCTKLSITSAVASLFSIANRKSVKSSTPMRRFLFPEEYFLNDGQRELIKFQKGLRSQSLYNLCVLGLNWAFDGRQSFRLTVKHHLCMLGRKFSVITCFLLSRGPNDVIHYEMSPRSLSSSQRSYW